MMAAALIHSTYSMARLVRDTDNPICDLPIQKIGLYNSTGVEFSYSKSLRLIKVLHLAVFLYY